MSSRGNPYWRLAGPRLASTQAESATAPSGIRAAAPPERTSMINGTIVIDALHGLEIQEIKRTATTGQWHDRQRANVAEAAVPA
jgi:hypothetical protein